MIAADIPECAQREILVQSIKESVTEFLPRKTVFITARKKEAREMFREVWLDDDPKRVNSFMLVW